MNAVYVSNAGSGDILVFHLDDAGTLAPVQRVAVGGKVMPLAVGPEGRHLYAARRSDPLEVLSFAIDPRTGELARLGQAPLPDSMAYLATDRSGRWLFSASYGGHRVAVGPIAADGVALAARQVLDTGPHAHAIVVHPSNRFVFAPILGGACVLQFCFDASTGELTPNHPPALFPHADASPRHLVFDGAGRFAYLLNELDAKVDVLGFDPTTGTLGTMQTVGSLPPGFTGEPWAADLHLTPDGRHLFTSERRSSTLAGFAVEAGGSRLRALGHTRTGAEPRGFAIAPGGRFLIAAGQASDQLWVHSLDPALGALGPGSLAAAGHQPNWVAVVDLERSGPLPVPEQAQ